MPGLEVPSRINLEGIGIVHSRGTNIPSRATLSSEIRWGTESEWNSGTPYFIILDSHFAHLKVS